MMQLSIKNQMLDISSDGFPIEITEALHSVIQTWPGVKGFDIWFVDPIFGRYKDQQQLAALEMLAAEEETDEYKDATAPSQELEEVQLAADEEPAVVDTTNEARPSVSSHDLETEHEHEDAGTTDEGSDLPLININVRS